MMCKCYVSLCFLFFKQKTAYEMRISDWSSDVCSSDLVREAEGSLCEGALLETLSHLGGRAELARRARIGAGGHRRDDLPRTHLAARRYRAGRSEERRVGKEGVSTGRYRWSPFQ